MDEIITSIDLGTSKICATIARVDKNNHLQIIGLGNSTSNGIRKGVVVDIEAVSQDVIKALEQAENMADTEVDAVYINIPGGYCDVISNKGIIAISGEEGEIDIEDVSRVLNSAAIVSIPQGQQIIDIIPEQYIVDGYDEIKDPIGMSGIRLEVEASIITSSTTTSLNIVKSINKAGLKVLGIIMEPFALAESILTKDEKELGVLLIDIGAGTSDISLFRNNKLIYSNILPIAGNHITTDISIGLRIPFDKSEELKKKYGIAYSTEPNWDNEVEVLPIGIEEKIKISEAQLIEMIGARIAEIFEMTNQLLVNNRLKDDILAGIVITGGGASYLKGATDLANIVFEMPARIGQPNYIGVKHPVFSTSVGLINYTLKRRFNYYVEYNNVEVRNSNHKGRVKKNKSKNKNKNNAMSTIKKIWDEYF